MADTPALAAYGMARSIPVLIITGSHIPGDPNGIKFYKPSGAVLKDDEVGIRAQRIELPPNDIDAAGGFRAPVPSALPAEDPGVLNAYVARYLDASPAGTLAGVHLGLYEHSSVSPEPFRRVLDGLGPRVTPSGGPQSSSPLTPRRSAQGTWMERLLAAGVEPVERYEANGGFLLCSPVPSEGGVLTALPTETPCRRCWPSLGLPP